MLVVLDDVDGFINWVPFCTGVTKHGKFSQGSYLVSYISDMPWPVKKRETMGYCGGVDALDEIGCAIVFLTTPTEPEILGLKVPDPHPKIPRLKASDMVFFIRPLSSGITAVEVVATIDPGISARLLKGLISWIVKNTVLDFFVKIAVLANKYTKEQIASMNLPNQFFYERMEKRAKAFLESGLAASTSSFLAPFDLPRASSSSQGGAVPSSEKGGGAENVVCDQLALLDEEETQWYKRLTTFKT